MNPLEKQALNLALQTLLRHQGEIARMAAGNNYYSQLTADALIEENKKVAKRVGELLE